MLLPVSPGYIYLTGVSETVLWLLTRCVIWLVGLCHRNILIGWLYGNRWWIGLLMKILLVDWFYKDCSGWLAYIEIISPIDYSGSFCKDYSG